MMKLNEIKSRRNYSVILKDVQVELGYVTLTD